MRARAGVLLASLVASAAAALMLAGAAAAAIPSVPNSAWQPSGPVKAVEPSPDGKYLYVGGQFDYLGPVTGQSVRLDGDGNISTTDWPEFKGGIVRDIISDGAGGWFVGGAFTVVDGQPARYLVHVLPWGALDLAWNPGVFSGGAGVIDLELSDDGTALYVAGSFSDVDGDNIGATNLAKFDAGTGMIIRSFSGTGTNAAVHAIVDQGGYLYVGGEFTTYRGVTQPRLLRLAADGSADSWLLATAPDGAVRDMALDGTDLYVVGDFTTPVKRGMSFDLSTPATPVATGWTPNANAQVHAIDVDASHIVIVGQFTTVGGANASRNHVAVFARGSSTPTAANPGASIDWSGTAANLAVGVDILPGGSSVRVGGSFDAVGGIRSRGAFSFSTSTGAVAAWKTRFGGAVHSFAEDGATLLTGGSFMSAGGVMRDSIAKIDLATGRPTTWNPQVLDGNGAAESINAIAATTSAIYVGGRDFLPDFSTSQPLVALDPASGGPAAVPLPSMSGANRVVHDIELNGSFVYVAGEFTGASANVMRFTPGTGFTDGWNPAVNGPVRSIDFDATNVYLAGDFTNVGGALPARSYAASIANSTGASISGWDPNVNAPAHAVSVEGMDVYVSGAFTTPANGFAHTSSSGALLGSTMPNGPVAAIDAAADGVFLAGTFSLLGTNGRPKFGALNPGGTALHPWVPNAPGSGIWSQAIDIERSGGYVFVGGENGIGIYESLTDTRAPVNALTGVDEVAPGVSPADGTHFLDATDTVYVRTNGPVTNPRFTVRTRAHDSYTSVNDGYADISGLETVTWPPIPTTLGSWSGGGQEPGGSRGLNLTCFDDSNFLVGGATGGTASAIDRSINYDGSVGKRPDQLPTLPAALMWSLHGYDDSTDGGTSFELFACRWKGFLVAPGAGAAGSYSFSAVADDAVRVNVGGTDGTWPTIDQWPGGTYLPGPAMPYAYSEARPITAEWKENANGASVQLRWEGPDWGAQPITEAAFVTKVDYARTYTLNSPGGTGDSGVLNVTARDRVGLNAMAPFRVVVDNAPPAFGGPITMSPLFGWSSSPSLSLSMPSSTDAGGSEVLTRTLERRSTALLPGGGCAAAPAWNMDAWTALPSAIGAGGGAFTDTGLVHGRCYQYRLVVVDNVGNPAYAEPAGQSNFANWHRVDLTVPTSVGVSYTVPNQVATSVDVSWTATDAESGIDPAFTYLTRQSASYANGICSSYGAPVQVGTNNPASTTTVPLADGQCVQFGVQVRNGAGSATTTSTLGPEIRTDRTPPTASLSVATGPTKGPISVAVSASDTMSGLGNATIYYDGPGTNDGMLCENLGASPWNQACSWTPASDGSYIISVVATDNAGNALATPVTQTILADNNPPVVSSVRLTESSSVGFQHVDPNTPSNLFFNPTTTGSVVVAVDATDTPAGVGSVQFSGLGAPWSNGGSDASPSGPTDEYSYAYTWYAGAPSSNGTILVEDTLFQQTARMFTVTADGAAPSGGSITYHNGLATNAVLTLQDGADTAGGSGIASSQVLRRSLALVAGTCPAAALGAEPWVATGMPTYTSIPDTAPGNEYTDTTILTNRCYQYALRVSDNVGNQAMYTSPAILTTAPAGLIIGPSSSSAGATEGGAPTTFSVRLRTAPTANVTVTYGGDTQVGPSAATALSFTDQNWNQPQTATVPAIDDALDDDAVGGIVTFNTSSPAPGDADYDAVPDTTVAVAVVDNDVPGLVLTAPSAGGVSVAEPATSSAYTVKLSSQPHGTVTVATGHGTQVKAAPAILTFDASNWNIAKPVTVQAVDDPDIEGAHTTTVTNTASATHAGDTGYAALAVSSIPVSIADDDVAGFVLDGPVNPELSEADPSIVATVRARLRARPTSDVTLNWVTSGGQLVASAPLTFTSANWSEWQVATIHAANDTVAEPPLHQVIGGAAATSTDPNFSALPPVTGPVTIRDDDVAAFVTTPGANWTTNDEGQLLLDESATSGSVLRIRAIGDPTSDIVITPAALPAEQLVISPATQTIPAGSHEQVVTFSVRAVNDRAQELDPHPAKVTWKVTTSDAMYGGAVLPMTVARIKDGETTTTRDTTDPTPDPSPTPDPTPDPTPTPDPAPTGDGGTSQNDDTPPQPTGDATTGDDGDAPGDTVADDGSAGDDAGAATNTNDPKRGSRASTRKKNPAKRLKDWASENKGKASVAASAAGTAALWGAKPLALAGKALMSGGGGFPGHPPGMGQARHLLKRKFRSKLKRFWRGKKRDVRRDDEDDWDDFLWGDRAA